MSKKITFLVENTADSRGLLGEHGLSALIQTEEQTILLDTGQGKVLKHNSQRLNIDTTAVDAVVLSHGHYDHTGGLALVLSPGKKTPVLALPSALKPKYARLADGQSRSIGIPEESRRALDLNGELIFPSPGQQIAKDVFLTGKVPRVTDFEDTGGDFYLDRDCLTPDPLDDDQAIYIQTKSGIVIITGCAHSGIVNILLHIRNLTDNAPVYFLMGGLHLNRANPDRLKQTAQYFKEFGLKRLMPCHCTGFSSLAWLWNQFPQSCDFCSAGTEITME